MARGHVPKREAKKLKKKTSKKVEIHSPMVVSEAVEVVGKRRKPKEDV